MRQATYRVFVLVAWPAAVWGTVEIALRLAIGDVAGLREAALIAGAAVATIVACGWRQRGLRASR